MLPNCVGGGFGLLVAPRPDKFLAHRLQVAEIHEAVVVGFDQEFDAPHLAFERRPQISQV